MTPLRMNRNRFEALIAAYGARPAHWPEEERGAMRALVAAEPWANELVAHEDILDAWLDAAPILGDARRLSAEVIAAAPRALARTRIWRWVSAIGLGAALAATGASGMAVGAVFAPAAALQLQQDRTPDPLQEAAVWIQSPDDAGQSG